MKIQSQKDMIEKPLIRNKQIDIATNVNQNILIGRYDRKPLVWIIIIRNKKTDLASKYKSNR